MDELSSSRHLGQLGLSVNARQQPTNTAPTPLRLVSSPEIAPFERSAHYRAGAVRGELSKPHNVFAWSGGSLMSNERNSHRTAVILFAVAMIIAILAAFVTTLERFDTRMANNESPPGTTGLAKPRPPLDRAPGQPVLGN
jgi:hypothetical protein